MATQNNYGIDFNIRSLGAVEAKLILSLEESRQPSVDLQQATQILGNGKSAQLALLRLVRKGWLDRVGRGRYVLHPGNTGYLDTRIMSPLKFAGNVSPETYVGWWAAAEYHGLTWQHPMLIRVASVKQLRSRHFESSLIEFVKVAPTKLFGFELAKEGFPVSTVAKTVIDCVDKPKFAGGYAEVAIILGNSLDKTDASELVSTAIRNGSISTMQRLGFLLEVVRPSLFDAEQRKKLKDQIGKGSRAKMGNPAFSDGDFGYQSSWHLQVNLNKTFFLGEVDRFGD